MGIFEMDGKMYTTHYTNLKRFAKQSHFEFYSTQLRETLIVEDDGAKIVYVDTGDGWDLFFDDVWDTVTFICQMQLKEDALRGVPGPRLIFVVQDKDYWPLSEDLDPSVIDRRAAKEKASIDQHWPLPPNQHDLFVPRTYKDTSYLRPYYRNSDLSDLCNLDLPGAKFIVNHLSPQMLSTIKKDFKSKPELLASLNRLLNDGSSSSSN